MFILNLFSNINIQGAKTFKMKINKNYLRFPDAGEGRS